MARQLATLWLHQFLLFRESEVRRQTVEIDIIDLRWPRELGAYQDMLPARCDADVRRWCDIASRRLRHVRFVRECGGRNSFNPVQTKFIVDCVASFPYLCEFTTRGGVETITTCTSLALHVRAGRLSNLQRIVIDGQGDMSIIRRDNPSTFNLRRIAKLAFEELISVLPPDRGIDCLVAGVYPDLMEIGDETSWDLWATTFFNLIAKGAEVRSRPHGILYMITCMHQFRWEGFRESVNGMETFYSTVERLLTEHGVDPNTPHDVLLDKSRTPLWMILFSLSETIEVVQRDLLAEVEVESDESDFEPEIDPELVVPMLRFFMRTVDLLVRHGARSTRADCVTRSGREDTTLHPWILARPDCTQAIRDAVARGELFHDKHA